MTRREATQLIGCASAGLLLPANIKGARATIESPKSLMRTIPVSGEKLPVVGLGTWQVFDVDPGRSAALEPVLSSFVKLGGRLIDTSPMYGRSEEVIGQLASKLKLRDSLFLATKVWTRGRQAGIESMERSFARLQTKTIDLMQVHNLVDAAMPSCDNARMESSRPAALHRCDALRRKRAAGSGTSAGTGDPGFSAN
jgi:diketogulonate reductase-like aldo/keto reductase